MELSLQQQTAIDFAVNTKKRVVAITGQAGTGKTTIMKMAVEQLRKQRRNVVLAAPTGKAARRIQEATGLAAVTIHKLLAYGRPTIDADTGQPLEQSRPYYGSFDGDGNKRVLPYNDIFIDEYMMVNEELHRNLLSAMGPGARLIAFGDVFQLPPIEGWELADIPDAPFQQILKLPSSVVLDQVFRQAEESGVLFNAKRIRMGLAPISRSDFVIQISEVPIQHLVEHVMESGINYNLLDNQVVIPTRRGKLGTHALNQVMQSIYHPHGGIDLPRDKWEEKHPIRVSIGEKVICNENIYDLRDFFDRFSVWDGDTPDWNSFIPCPDSFMILNGETGIVQDILPDGSLYIELADRIVQMPSSYREHIPRYNRLYQRDPRKKLDLGYAITTHKMQGSECSHVTYVIHRSIAYMVNRNNIYTAITRAKNSVHLVTDAYSLNRGPRLTAQQKAAITQKNKTETITVGDMSR